MAPAEIWQGGKVVNLIEKGGVEIHYGKLDGQDVSVVDDPLGCAIVIEKEPLIKSKVIHLFVGQSRTLDGGEIVKSVAGIGKKKKTVG